MSVTISRSCASRLEPLLEYPPVPPQAYISSALNP